MAFRVDYFLEPRQRRLLLFSVVSLGCLFMVSSYFLWYNDLSSSRPLREQDNSTPLSNSATNYAFDRVAVIIENRDLSNLVPIILHFLAVLGPKWHIQFYTSKSSPPPSAALARAIQEKRVVLRQLPENVAFGSHRDVSNFLTGPWLWEQLAPAKHALLFQADSILCSNAPQSVEDFLQYDFIGAPISSAYGVGYNGGLSMRNIERTLEVIRRNAFQDDQDKGGPENEFEDQWFYQKMKALPAKGDGSPGANLPSVEVAQTFAVETIYYDRPLGYHQPARWQAEHMDQIRQWCPEINLAISGQGLAYTASGSS